MRLYLLRHADAVPAKKESQRKLSPKGIESINRLTAFLAKTEALEIDEIRHSPLTMARQTAKHFKKMAGLKAKLREVPLMEPFDDFRILGDIVNTADRNLLLVGHQPNLGMLASYLLNQEYQSNLFNLKKSGLLCLERPVEQEEKVGWKSIWQLNWSLDPRLLR
jgi:phosphohistidine phosphatase